MSDPVSVRRVGPDWVLQTSLWLPRPRTEVFEFFSDAHNLEDITPPILRFEVLTPKPIPMKAGALIDYKLKVRGLPIRWRTEIAIWEPEHRFVDTQIKGPYVRWWHEHTFEDHEGGTLCKDRVEYRPPGGPLAPIVNAIAVERDVRGIFDFRRKKLLELFPAQEHAPESALA